MTEENINTRILKSTAVIGGASALNILFRIVQAKIVAVLLGPQGMGLMGLFNSILGVASTWSGMGIATSGVREIAASAESGDKVQFSRTVLTFRRLSLVLGGIGALTVFGLRRWISEVTFGSEDYSASVGWLSLAVFFMVIASSQMALIRGVRRIGDLARVSVLGTAAGTLLGVPMMIGWGQQGVVFYVVGVAATTILVSWWYARRVQVESLALSWSETRGIALGLLRLGLAFVSAGLLTLLSAYLVKVFVTRQLGVHATGLYEAASALANVYVGFILGAMGADFFPHLAGASQDDAASNRLINAQAQIGTLLALPGILAVLAFGPWLLKLLYSAEFAAAFDIFRWQALGTYLRLVSWPLGFLLVAKAKGSLYLFTEFISNLFFLGAAWLGLQLWGVTGAGAAFFALYLFYTALMTFVGKRLSGFAWTSASLRIFGWTLAAVTAAFAFSFITPAPLAFGLGAGLTLVAGAFALKTLRDLIGVDVFRSRLQRIFSLSKVRHA
ncbi:MAG: O-antigen translocase [Chloroflexota bacterium]